MCDVGLIGLAVMGQNFALNIAEKGFSIAVFNRTTSKVKDTVEIAQRESTKEKPYKLFGYHTIEEFVDALSIPRKIILLVQSGKPVDLIIEKLIPLLSAGDIIIDGGNEWYKITEARMEKLLKYKIQYIGMGISGGEEGARIGPSLMPGGPREAYNIVEPILKKVAVIVDGEPCVSYMGKSGSGNYVKMIHNGIEYGDMELIAETYNILRMGKGLSLEEIANVFNEWNKGELKSFLIEITIDILRKKDDQTDGYLLDQILAVAGSKGTGMWTIEESTRRGIPCPTIEAALNMRYLSTLREVRNKTLEAYPANQKQNNCLQDLSIDELRDALICSKISSYAQGLMLLKHVSDEEDWDINIAEITRGWCGGCIIRADLLFHIRKAYLNSPKLKCLLFDPYFVDKIKQKIPNWRKTVVLAIQAGLPVPGLAASLTFFDALCSDKLPVNLIQAQRDFFGAHTYKRIDDDAQGVSTARHTIWRD